MLVPAEVSLTIIVLLPMPLFQLMALRIICCFTVLWYIVKVFLGCINLKVLKQVKPEHFT